jgi:hypothetical protein
VFLGGGANAAQNVTALALLRAGRHAGDVRRLFLRRHGDDSRDATRCALVSEESGFCLSDAAH